MLDSEDLGEASYSATQVGAHEEAHGPCYLIFENATRTGVSGVRPAKVATWHSGYPTQHEINGHMGDMLGLPLSPYLLT